MTPTAAAGGRTVNITPRTALVALAGFSIAALGITMFGFGNGRPPGVANQPGDNYVELADLTGDLDRTVSELKMRVHYKFPDDLPHPDTWFQFGFEVNDGKSGTV